MQLNNDIEIQRYNDKMNDTMIQIDGEQEENSGGVHQERREFDGR